MRFAVDDGELAAAAARLRDAMTVARAVSGRGRFAALQSALPGWPSAATAATMGDFWARTEHDLALLLGGHADDLRATVQGYRQLEAASVRALQAQG